jgi:putative transposase
MPSAGMPIMGPSDLVTSNQGRFKAFPVETDDHFLKVCRYAERNALRANLVGRAQDWRWCSLWHRERGDELAQRLLSEWPVDRPSNWLTWVNEPQTPQDLEAIRASLCRGRPYGSESWHGLVLNRVGHVFSPRPRGRPRKMAPDPI